ncbi:MAG: hypothetical protein CMJ94_02720 [Planctomycetes bacterium]|nr:hypothetical protein [Planctomycetota bacterium]
MSTPRIEHDTLGPVEVPHDALYGAQTARAVANFPLSGRPLPWELIRALVEIKAAAARAHGEAGRIPTAVAAAIEAAAEEVLQGDWTDQFPVDIFQTGSGTSSNMNVNEVLARRASQLLEPAGETRQVHPNDQVNLGQSSNDVFPSAMHLASLRALRNQLLPALRALATRCHAFADTHFDQVKNGRTHLMDAMPIRFGQEFRGYAQQCERGAARLEACAPELAELALGGTAVGTGVNAPEGFAEAVCRDLADRTGLPLQPSPQPFQAQSSLDALTHFSGALRGVASSLYKIANDLRWMASGPLSGLHELEIPAVQPGSSIMPAKVNPVICESVLMACVQIFGHDHTVGFANSQGQFELNTMLPLVGCNVLESCRLLSAACLSLNERCLAGARPTDSSAARVAQNPILVTALVPKIGYEAAAALAKEAARTGRSLRELAAEHTELQPDEIDTLLDPARLCGERGAPSPRDSSTQA